MAGGVGESALAQTWAQRAPGTGAGARFGHALAYDNARGKGLLFRGYGSSYLADTWQYDGTNWSQRTPATSPPARCDHALAYMTAPAAKL